MDTKARDREITRRRNLLSKKVEIILFERFVEASEKQGFEKKFKDVIYKHPGRFNLRLILENHDGYDYFLDEDIQNELFDRIDPFQEKFDAHFIEKHRIGRQLLEQYHNNLESAMFETREVERGELAGDIAHDYFCEFAVESVNFLIKYKVPKIMWGIDICHEAADEIVSGGSHGHNIRIIRAVGVDTTIRSFSIDTDSFEK